MLSISASVNRSSASNVNSTVFATGSGQITVSTAIVKISINAQGNLAFALAVHEGRLWDVTGVPAPLSSKQFCDVGVARGSGTVALAVEGSATGKHLPIRDLNIDKVVVEGIETSADSVKLIVSDSGLYAFLELENGTRVKVLSAFDGKQIELPQGFRPGSFAFSPGDEHALALGIDEHSQPAAFDITAKRYLRSGIRGQSWDEVRPDRTGKGWAVACGKIVRIDSDRITDVGRKVFQFEDDSLALSADGKVAHARVASGGMPKLFDLINNRFHEAPGLEISQVDKVLVSPDGLHSYALCNILEAQSGCQHSARIVDATERRLAVYGADYAHALRMSADGSRVISVDSSGVTDIISEVRIALRGFMFRNSPEVELIDDGSHVVAFVFARSSGDMP